MCNGVNTRMAIRVLYFRSTYFNSVKVLMAKTCGLSFAATLCVLNIIYHNNILGKIIFSKYILLRNNGLKMEKCAINKCWILARGAFKLYPFSRSAEQKKYFKKS